MKNWKTTSAGIILIVGGLVGLYTAYKSNQLNEGTVTGAVTAILSGVGLVLAKDNNVTGGTVTQ